MSNAPPDAERPEEIVWRGRFVEARRRGKWEYAGRPGGMRAAVILAVDAGEIVLIEQYRVPLGATCLEMPAGLIGDDDGGTDEDPFAAAQRELCECVEVAQRQARAHREVRRELAHQ